MSSLKDQLTALLADTFTTCGFDASYGEVVVSNRPDLAQFQCNGALVAAKTYDTPPRQIAQAIVERLAASGIFQAVSVAGPGFINLTLTDDYLVNHLRTPAADERLGCPQTDQPLRMIIDYGGAGIAKPMHVGHLRAAI